MPDRKPPRSAASELETLHALWQFQRESVVRKVTGVSEEDARRSPVGSGTSLLWLVRHLVGAEVVWVVVRFAGRPTPPAGHELDDGTLADAVRLYRDTWAEVDRIVFEAADLEVLCRNPPEGPPTNLRWVVGHLLEETARHAGHADILRELIDGDTGR